MAFLCVKLLKEVGLLLLFHFPAPPKGSLFCSVVGLSVRFSGASDESFKKKVAPGSGSWGQAANVSLVAEDICLCVCGSMSVYSPVCDYVYQASGQRSH